MRKQITIDEATVARLKDLAPLYEHNDSQTIRAAIAALHAAHHPDAHPLPPHVIGWQRITLAAATTCADTGRPLAAGSEAWREEWSDGRPGAVVSDAALD